MGLASPFSEVRDPGGWEHCVRFPVPEMGRQAWAAGSIASASLFLEMGRQAWTAGSIASASLFPEMGRQDQETSEIPAH